MTFGNGSVQSFTYATTTASLTDGRVETITNNLGGAATTHDLTQTFDYNPAGQIQKVVRSNDAYAWQAHYNVDRAYVADGLNRIMSAGGIGFSYDLRGNLTNDGTNSFTYTSENMLKTAPGGATLSYDPLGRLYETVKSPTTTRFQYDGVDRIAEYNGSNVVQTRYVHGHGVDNPIVWYDGSAISNTTRRFLMADERGSVVSITDSAGATVHINAYDEYGIPAPGNIGRFGYTGQTWLPEVGMWYYKARMYSPTLGRFMQTDPIGYSDGMNWYNYVGSDPVNGTDPTGEVASDGLEDLGTSDLARAYQLRDIRLEQFDIPRDVAFDTLVWQGWDKNAPPGSPCLGFGPCDSINTERFGLVRLWWEGVRDGAIYQVNRAGEYVKNCASGVSSISGRQVAIDAGRGAGRGLLSGGAGGAVGGSFVGPAGTVGGAIGGAATGSLRGAGGAAVTSAVRQACAAGNS